MTFGQEAPKDKPQLRNHEDCQHGGAFCEGVGQEEIRDNYDEFSGEYDTFTINVEYWVCPQCGATWDYEVE